MKLGLVFSGQGSQYQGMAIDLIESNPEFYGLINQANEILGYDILKILRGENQELSQTLYVQPAILMHSILAFSAFKKLNVRPSGVLGFSLGEYSALYASDVFCLIDIIGLIKKRAELMQEATIKYPGKMAAILNADLNIIKEAIHLASKNGVVDIANYNSPVQHVISGESACVDFVIQYLKEQGVKRVIELSVSGAFHSKLMRESGDLLYQYLKKLEVKPPTYPIYLNSTAKPLVFEELFNEMKKQIQSSVYFEQSIINMKNDGFTHFIEIGPGKVLTGLIKKIDPLLEVFNLEKQSDLNILEGWLISHGFKQ
jgi:[acyl-carrier-protein] S-malonyltransferase